MLMIRLKTPFLIKERSSHPLDHNYSALSPHWPALLAYLSNHSSHISGFMSCFGSVFSHDPHWLLLDLVLLLFFVYHLGQMTHIFSYFI